MNLTQLKKEASNYNWNLCNHTYLSQSKTDFLGLREVVSAQSNGVWLKNLKTGQKSWLEYPKAANCCFFMSSGNLCLSIQINPEEDPGARMVYELQRKVK